MKQMDIDIELGNLEELLASKRNELQENANKQNALRHEEKKIYDDIFSIQDKIVLAKRRMKQ